ncbi:MULTISPECIES: hemin uptake protein HemP [Thiorhodococcus]|uniref:Hemin uptake protein hemP n=2 Tax=Thiorhodococcus TaxID=57488 RepID=G2E0F6_9GAMM|nr:hemin uptake protein HemP [Thiorhodococcus drewsii]EGV31884.1 Hemin uptake protein hemP [Thiorhodococcus drewsii AZ1]
MPPVASTDSRSQISPRDRSPGAHPRRIDSNSLMGGDNLLMIEHAGHQYYLRMTRNNKLILTK